MVSEGEFIWTYDPKTNTVMKMEMPETPILGEIDYVEIIGKFLNETDISLLGVKEIDGRPAYLLETSLKEEGEGFPVYRWDETLGGQRDLDASHV